MYRLMTASQPRFTLHWLDNARIVSCFAVVFLHTAGSIVYHYTGPHASYFLAGSLFNAFSRWSVPFFLMISGALLLNPQKNESVAIFYRKRFGHILIPLFFWTAIYSLIRLLPFLHDSGAFRSESAKLFADIIAGNPYYHMWYLYMLVGIYLFLPIVRFCVRAAPLADLRLLCAVWFAIAIVSSAVWSFGGPHGGRFSIFIGSFFEFMPYCIAGYLIAAMPSGRRGGLLWLVAGASGFASIFISYLLAGEQDEIRFYSYSFISVTVVPLSLALFALARRLTKPLLGERWTSRAANLTFGIYLVHPAILKLMESWGITATMMHPLLAIPLTAGSAFLLSGLATAALTALPGLRRTV
jgi:surface polysaccharide O-acyltransferase-like enzyme